METKRIMGQNGYEIPCVGHPTKGELAVVICHGFGSSKESPTALAVDEALRSCGIGTFRFDLPAHGESPAEGDMLRVEACLNDLAAVEAHARAAMPGADIAYFSSSFGAYLNLNYLATREHGGKKSFLRCAAVDMPGLFRRLTTREQYAQLDEQGFFVLKTGYDRPLKITRGFYDDLAAYDVFRLWKRGIAALRMIHGTADETASIRDARRFAEQFGARLIEVEGADHRFQIPGGMERVVRAAVDFFTH